MRRGIIEEHGVDDGLVTARQHGAGGRQQGIGRTQTQVLPVGRAVGLKEVAPAGVCYGPLVRIALLEAYIVGVGVEILAGKVAQGETIEPVAVHTNGIALDALQFLAEQESRAVAQSEETAVQDKGKIGQIGGTDIVGSGCSNLITRHFGTEALVCEIGSRHVIRQACQLGHCLGAIDRTRGCLGVERMAVSIEVVEISLGRGGLGRHSNYVKIRTGRSVVIQKRRRRTVLIEVDTTDVERKALGSVELEDHFSRRGIGFVGTRKGVVVVVDVLAGAKALQVERTILGAGLESKVELRIAVRLAVGDHLVQRSLGQNHALGAVHRNESVLVGAGGVRSGLLLDDISRSVRLDVSHIARRRSFVGGLCHRCRGASQQGEQAEKQKSLDFFHLRFSY